MLRRMCALTASILLVVSGSLVVADDVFVPIGSAGKPGGVTRDLNPPIDINTKVGDPTKQVVLIYYANETAPNEAERKNYDQIIQWLRTSDDENVTKIAGQLEKDLAEFASTVDEELAAIQRNLTEDTKKLNVSVVVFTNRLARAGKFRVWRRGASQFEDGSIEVPKFDISVYDSNPLAHADVFQSALLAAAKQFDPAEHDFVLVTKSHGSSDVAMRPRIIVDVSKINRDQVLAFVKAISETEAVLVEEERPPGKKGLEVKDGLEVKPGLGTDPTSQLEDKPGLGTDATSQLEDKPGLGHDPTSQLGMIGEFESTGDRVGITKNQYVTTLRTVVDETGMKFPLLFMESCKSQLDGVDLVELKRATPSIGRVYTSDLTGLQYSTVDYDEVFRRAAESDSFVDAVHQTLFQKYEEQKAVREKEGDDGEVGEPDKDQSGENAKEAAKE